MIKKTLGKKQTMNNGTLQAFACTCTGCTPVCACKTGENKTDKYYGYWAKLNNASFTMNVWS